MSISHTKIPEEKEEEEEQEESKEDNKMMEQDISAPNASSAQTRVSQPVAATSQEGEESRKEEAEVGMKDNTEEKEGEREVGESPEDPMMTPEEAPNGITQPEESVTGTAAPPEEEKEPKMNGETSVVEPEPRPQVICCSEVKSSPGHLQSFPGLRSFIPAVEIPTSFSFLLTSVPVFLPACANI